MRTCQGRDGAFMGAKAGAEDEARQRRDPIAMALARSTPVQAVSCRARLWIYTSQFCVSAYQKQEQVYDRRSNLFTPVPTYFHPHIKESGKQSTARCWHTPASAPAHPRCRARAKLGDSVRLHPLLPAHRPLQSCPPECTPRLRRRPHLCQEAGAHLAHWPAARPRAPRTAARRKQVPPGSFCAAHAHTRARPCLHVRVRRSVSTDQAASWRFKGYTDTAHTLAESTYRCSASRDVASQRPPSCMHASFPELRAGGFLPAPHLAALLAGTNETYCKACKAPPGSQTRSTI